MFMPNKHILYSSKVYLSDYLYYDNPFTYKLTRVQIHIELTSNFDMFTLIQCNRVLTTRGSIFTYFYMMLNILIDDGLHYQITIKNIYIKK